MTTALLLFLLLLMLGSGLTAMVTWARNDRLAAGRGPIDDRAAAHRDRRPSAGELSDAGASERPVVTRTAHRATARAPRRVTTTVTRVS
ncbi:hypothetical protein [Nocardioides sp. BYT-33-1]|jgi:hypothetical protein|uniref:hypothetical protein n=1 Tax=Nocardioides sp. BYT-33-1 TaxID=3416952 RepID=UPI003F52FBF2